MEEKRLDAAESLELIGRMIRNTRQRLERHSGRPFLIWGYTTVGVSLLNYALNLTGADPNWSLSWFLIPVLGYTLMRLFPEKRPTDPRTEIDRIVHMLWLVCSLALIPISCSASSTDSPTVRASSRSSASQCRSAPPLRA